MKDDNIKKQQTPTGHEIPVPKKGEFFDNLKKASEPEKKDEQSESDENEEEDNDAA